MPEEETRSLADELGLSTEEAGEEQTQTEGGEEVAQTEVEQTEVTTEQTGEGTQADETTQEESKFFETFNQKWNTEYQSDDDIASLLESQKEFSDLKEKSTEWSDFETREKDYKSKIAELEDQLDPLKHFPNKESYIEMQLRMQHPDKNPAILHEVVTKDLSEMSDMDVLIKSTLLDVPDIEGGEEGVREHLYNRYGVEFDEDGNPEFTRSIKNSMKIDASRARKELAQYKDSVELPKVMTPEEKEQALQEAKESRAKEISPYLEEFKKFDKWSVDLGDDKQFEFEVPNDFKQSLEDMFKGYFVDGDQPVNEENLETIVQLRNGLFLNEYFPKIYEVIQKEAITQQKEAQDALLNNEEPENKSTATDQDRESKDESQNFLDWVNRGI